MAIIGIDVDLTVVRTDKSWWEWLASRCDNKRQSLPDGELNYNLASYFPEVSDPYGYWRHEDVYDDLTPMEECVDIIRDLCERHEVIFISACKGNHHKSKYYFLKRHFPKMSGFLATKEKQYVNCDVLIDDRNNFLNITPAKHKLKLKTQYTQDEELTAVVAHCDDWNHIDRVLKQFKY